MEIAFESTHTLATGLDSVRETIATAFELQTNEADQRFHKTMDGQKQISTRLSSQVHTLCHGGLLWKRSTREESENKSETNRSVDNRRLSFVLFDAFVCERRVSRASVRSDVVWIFERRREADNRSVHLN